MARGDTAQGVMVEAAMASRDPPSRDAPWHVRPGSGVSVTQVTHPLVRHKLSLLRDVETDTEMFRRLVNELTLLLTYEATKDLALETVEVETPLERTTGERIPGKKIAACPILRA